MSKGNVRPMCICRARASISAFFHHPGTARVTRLVERVLLDWMTMRKKEAQEGKWTETVEGMYVIM